MNPTGFPRTQTTVNPTASPPDNPSTFNPKAVQNSELLPKIAITPSSAPLSMFGNQLLRLRWPAPNEKLPQFVLRPLKLRGRVESNLQTSSHSIHRTMKR